MLYNFASSANNNGSAFAFQGTGTQWYTTTQGLSMLMGRFFTDHPGARHRRLARRQAQGARDRRHDADATTPLFGFLIVGVVVIVAGLTFFPALALGPILEHLSL